MMQDDSNMAANAICHEAHMAGETWKQSAYEYQRPSVVFKPSLFKDGDMWCALFGADLQSGVAGFGPRPCDAMWAFDTAWLSEGGSHVIERKVQP